MLRSVACAAAAAFLLTFISAGLDSVSKGGSVLAAQKSGGGDGGGNGKGGGGTGKGGGGGKNKSSDGAAAAKACPDGQTYQCRPSPTKGVADICGCRKVAK